MDRRRFSPDDSFVATLDAMVLYVAFGTIRRDFPDVSAAALSWILSGYTIVLAAKMIGAVVDPFDATSLREAELKARAHEIPAHRPARRRFPAHET